MSRAAACTQLLAHTVWKAAAAWVRCLRRWCGSLAWQRELPEVVMRKQLVAAWVTAARNSTLLRLKLQGDAVAELTVSSRAGAEQFLNLCGARLKKEHYRNGGVAKSRFVLCDEGGSPLAVFGVLFGHAEGAPFVQIVGEAGDEETLEPFEDWVVVATEQVVTAVPEEVEREAARIASVKARERRWPGDGNLRPVPAPSAELRASLYRDSFAASTQEIEVDASWTCAICLRGPEPLPRQLPCGHAFHGACIKAWLRHGSKCPLGRCLVHQDVLAALRTAMDFSLPEMGAWPMLPADVVKDSGVAEHGNGRAALPHERRGRGWQRFRCKDFNAQILVERLC
ncbi:unnamed protein product [Effrenium voratum]|uniref:RING-type domain-containing protein n=1 Tax=Effrenium voratum TaxID=2562239 RepID=A0AA36I5D2_9DINO|nr:unnamed protein product [Effrenium voratum]CAJ1380498.1 unnamed protein product [Effrenium voratum]CAJ1443497.1 unnamed protein product [Effrenium voratum]